MSSKIVVSQLDRLLKPLGFSRQRGVWNHGLDSMVDVIDVQVSKARDVITVNAGVLDRAVYATFWDKVPPEFIDQPLCTVCVRIGQLIDGKDKWWQLTDQEAAPDIVERVAAHVLPFLERTHTREAMTQLLIGADVTKKKYPPPIINLAILKCLQGEVTQGCEMLAELQRKALGDWPARAAEVAVRLRCV